jgi:hypothetical protein
MTDQNGWPDASKPGYPLNPDRDGWHWVDRPMHGVLPMQWLEIAGGGWVGKHTCLTALEATKAGWRYLGPCHTPTEGAALVEAARREEREACAEVCDERGEAETQTLNDGSQHYRPHADRREAQRCAAAIRARGDA